MKFSSAKGYKHLVPGDTVKPEGIPDRKKLHERRNRVCLGGVFEAQDRNLQSWKSLWIPGGIVLRRLLDGSCSSSCSCSKEEVILSRSSCWVEPGGHQGMET